MIGTIGELDLIKYIDGSKYRDIYAVGDIHGEYTKFITQLKALGFDEELDLVIGVGDLCDRGSESEKSAFLPNQPWFETTYGNHEDFCVQGFSDYHYEFYHKMPNNGGAWFYMQPDEVKAEIVDIFKSLPYLIELSYKGRKYGFVHADLPYEDWEYVKECVIQDDYIGDRKVRAWCIWARELVNADQAQIAQVDQVFIGHTMVNGYKDVGNVKFIDSGAVFTGGDLTIIKL